MKRILFVGIAGALFMSACSSVAPAAVTVNGTRVSERSVTDELAEIAGNRRYRQALGLPDVSGTGRQGTVKAAFAAQVVTLRIYYTLVEQELARRGVKVGADALAAARRELVAGLGPAGEQVLRSFPASYRDALVRRNAAVLELQRVLAGADVTEAGLRRWYDAHRDELTRVCASHILAAVRTPQGGVDEAASRAKIDRIAARLASGEDFAAVARAESDDPGSRDKGGDLGCAEPSRYVTPFAEAVRTQPVGRIGAPVQTSFGFHIIRVDGRQTPAFSEVRDEIRQRLEGEAGTKLNAWLVRALERAEVRVNPKFGTFVRHPDSSECTTGLPCVVPPQAPGG